MKSEGKDFLGSLQVIVSSSCFVGQLWWEALPWVSIVVPLNRSKGCEMLEVRDDG